MWIKEGAVSEQSQEQVEPDESSHGEVAGEPESHGTLSVEDDPDGTKSPADLAGSASADDATVGYQPSANEADKI